MLRQYQIDAIEKIYAHWRSGVRKVLLNSPTGSGKTVILAEIVARETSRVVLVVRGRELVGNLSTRLGLAHDVVMAGRRWGDERIAVCSIDTMRERGEYPDADLVVIDEAHQTGNDSYRNLAFMYPEARFLSVTATPYIQESLRHVADVIVTTCTMKELIHDGFLVPPRYFAPSAPDLSKVRVAGGEYHQGDLERAVSESRIVGDVVESCRDVHSGLLFCSSVAHSRLLRGRLEVAGIPAGHIDAATNDQERHRIIDDHRRGHLRVICNVGCLTTGVDLPWLRTIIDAAPTLSLVRNIQKLGRGTRPFPGKTHFDVLDHAANVHQHGFITDDFPPTIDGNYTRAKGKALVTTCAKCYAVRLATISRCPSCNHVSTPSIGRSVKVVDGRLLPILESERRTPDQNAMIMGRKLMKIATAKGIRRGWIYFQIKKKFGDAVAQRVCRQLFS